MYYSHSLGCEELRQFIEYCCDIWEPMIPQITQDLQKDRTRLETGLEFFRSIAHEPEGIATIIIYRATAKRL